MSDTQNNGEIIAHLPGGIEVRTAHGADGKFTSGSGGGHASIKAKIASDAAASAVKSLTPAVATLASHHNAAQKIWAHHHDDIADKHIGAQQAHLAAASDNPSKTAHHKSKAKYHELEAKKHKAIAATLPSKPHNAAEASMLHSMGYKTVEHNGKHYFHNDSGIK